MSLSISAVVAACKPLVEETPRVLGLYLFGSRADGEVRSSSDVDLGVLFTERVEVGEVIRLEHGFETALGHKVNLVDVGHCNAFVALDVIRGERIFEADPVALDHFDLYVMRRAGDLAPFARERRRMLLGGEGATTYPGRVRESVVAEKAARVRRMLAGVSTLPLASLGDFSADPRMPAAGESFLRRALEALLDLGRHLLAKGFAVPAIDYKEIPIRLQEAGVLDDRLTDRFVAMAGHRNRLTHSYDEVTQKELYGILTGELEDVETVLAALLAWVAEHPDRVDRSL